jgi:hypothetical protein
MNNELKLKLENGIEKTIWLLNHKEHGNSGNPMPKPAIRKQRTVPLYSEPELVRGQEPQKPSDNSSPHRMIDIESTRQKLTILELTKSNAQLRKVFNLI